MDFATPLSKPKQSTTSVGFGGSGASGEGMCVAQLPSGKAMSVLYSMFATLENSTKDMSQLRAGLTHNTSHNTILIYQSLSTGMQHFLLDSCYYYGKCCTLHKLHRIFFFQVV